MYPLISSLFILPVVVSGLLLVLSQRVARLLVIATAIILATVSVCVFIFFDQSYHLQVALYTDRLVAVADLILLLFFGWVGIRRKSAIVVFLAILQAAVFLYLIKSTSSENSTQFLVDKLTVFMFLLINVISGIICVFSLKYIDQEDCSSFRKKYFLSILFWFIAVMNLVVSSDNLDYFFLFFELTTLASFLLISFRRDTISVKNGLTALWMNQIGGLAILIAIFYIHYNGYGAATFSNLLSHASTVTILAPLALLSMAALIKGAQMPFSKWLLGAMVAPTPVSALLHSSTMVKIAPYMILRLSPALKGTPVAWMVIALTGFVFAASATIALSQDNLKRILAHSTIALLALMVMMGAVATPVTLMAALILMVFHGISKCMLFLNAGVMEKEFHLKQTSDMDRLMEVSPFTSFVIIIGFMSLLLPPFGAFIGKWVSIETLGAYAITQKLLGALVIVLIAFGGAVLTLLYFKVLGACIERTGDRDKISFEKESPFYFYTIFILLGLIVAGVLSFPFLLTNYFAPVAAQLAAPVAITAKGWSIQIGAMTLPLVPLLVAFLLVPSSIVLAMFIRFKNVDRAKEYACGEKVNYSFSALYFSTDNATPYFTAIGILFFLGLVAVTVL